MSAKTNVALQIAVLSLYPKQLISKDNLCLTPAVAECGRKDQLKIILYCLVMIKMRTNLPCIDDIRSCLCTLLVNGKEEKFSSESLWSGS